MIVPSCPLGLPPPKTHTHTYTRARARTLLYRFSLLCVSVETRPRVSLEVLKDMYVPPQYQNENGGMNGGRATTGAPAGLVGGMTGRKWYSMSVTLVVLLAVRRFASRIYFTAGILFGPKLSFLMSLELSLSIGINQNVVLMQLRTL